MTPAEVANEMLEKYLRRLEAATSRCRRANRSSDDLAGDGRRHHSFNNFDIDAAHSTGEAEALQVVIDDVRALAADLAELERQERHAIDCAVFHSNEMVHFPGLLRWVESLGHLDFQPAATAEFVKIGFLAKAYPDARAWALENLANSRYTVEGETVSTLRSQFDIDKRKEASQ